MYIRLPDFHDSATPVQPPNLNPLKSLFQERADALSNAATLLAGSKGAALVFAIRDALQRDDHLGRGVKTALQRLLDILSLRTWMISRAMKLHVSQRSTPAIRLSKRFVCSQTSYGMHLNTRTLPTRPHLVTGSSRNLAR